MKIEMDMDMSPAQAQRSKARRDAIRKERQTHADILPVSFAPKKYLGVVRKSTKYRDQYGFDRIND
jgi:hypothetical protein